MSLDPAGWLAAGTPLPALVGAMLALSLVSAVVPVVSMELVVALAALAAPTRAVPALVVLGTAAHMLGKAAIYLAARFADRLPEGRVRRRILAARQATGRHRDMGSAVLFLSASVGIPPFFLATVTSGALALPFGRFLLVGFVGRLLRFGLVAAFPAALASLWR